VQGIPLSTTSQRTFRDRQQEHALEARLLTVLPLVGSPAIDTFRLACGGIVGSTAAAIGVRDMDKATYELEHIGFEKRIEAEGFWGGLGEGREKSRDSGNRN